MRFWSVLVCTAVFAFATEADAAKKKKRNKQQEELMEQTKKSQEAAQKALEAAEEAKRQADAAKRELGDTKAADEKRRQDEAAQRSVEAETARVKAEQERKAAEDAQRARSLAVCQCVDQHQRLVTVQKLICEMYAADPVVDDLHPVGQLLGREPLRNLDAEPVVAQEDVADAGDHDPGAHTGSTSSGRK